MVPTPTRAEFARAGSDCDDFTSELIADDLQ
jgi:hypothetical protein